MANTPERRVPWNLLSPSEAEYAELQYRADDVVGALREPYLNRPGRLPADVERWAWLKWFETSLPLAMVRVARLLHRGVRLAGQGWFIRTLQPLAGIGDCDIVPRSRVLAEKPATERLLETYDAAATAAHQATRVLADQRVSREELAATEPHLIDAAEKFNDLRRYLRQEAGRA